ncbi:MAG: methyltransferase domain-containing protein [Flavobacteriaceae bacterium]|nr:methyltransferase domain-containing protein [Flavobacteriaceae bacterium]
MKQKPNNINGVLYLTEKRTFFSANYISVREKEGRILSDQEVYNLPNPLKSNKNFKEWQLRKKSSNRFVSYLKNKDKPLNILDIGSGNGWFSNALAIIEKTTVDAIDINTEELEQAARVFNKENLSFIYVDIFESLPAFKNKYDIITLNASIQYFDNLEKLLKTLKSFLKPNGEIHILDSPFYQDSEIEAAKKRTKDYYKKLGASGMDTYYFHHSDSILKKSTILYSPKRGVFKKLFFLKDIPFYWVKF